MELWVSSIRFGTVETIVILVCGFIIVHYLIYNNSLKENKYAKSKSSTSRNIDAIAICIVGLALDEIRRRNVDINDDKSLLEVITMLSMDVGYRERFIDRNLEELRIATREKNVEKIISLIRKEIL